jgi:uncharacterized protein
MTKDRIIKKTREFVSKKLAGDTTGHDWFHIQRVVRNARLIGKKEKADLFVVELAALLHDIADWKFHKDPNEGVKLTKSWLSELKLNQNIIDEVVYVVQHISFKGGTNKHKMKTIEGMVVQDADRLDALGAIGIARAFAYGEYKKRPIYDPKILPQNFNKPGDFAKYKNYNGTTINHFYEKILWLRDLMNTRTGYKLAGVREKFVKDYLKQFYKEWGE